MSELWLILQNVGNYVHHKVNELQLLIEVLKKPLVIRFFLWTDGKFLKGGAKKIHFQWPRYTTGGHVL